MESPQRSLLTTIPDLNREIFLKLDDNSLGRICETSKVANDMCNDDSFWRERIMSKFDIDLTKYKDEKSSYRDMYIFLKEYNARGLELLLDKLYIYGHLPILKYLIEEKIKINAYHSITTVSYSIIHEYTIDNYYYTLERYLSDIAVTGNIEFFLYLIGKGVNIVGTRTDRTSLEMASSNGHLNIVEYIVQNYKPDIEQLNSALCFAAHNGQSIIIRYLAGKCTAKTVNRALIRAAESGHLNAVKCLIEEAGATALTSALVNTTRMINMSLEVIKYLVSKGADKHYNNDEALKSLMSSYDPDEYEAIEYLQK